jgi:lysophospholipase
MVYLLVLINYIFWHYKTIFMKNIVFISTLVFLIIQSSCKVGFDIAAEQVNTYGLTTEKQLSTKNHVDEIEKLYTSGIEGFFPGKANVDIYYKIFQQPGKEKAAILISTGRTEAAIKYKEFIYDLYNNGYSVYIHDHRGQGLSGRMTEDPDMGYIDTFQYYIDDMKYFYEHMLSKEKHQKKYLIAHSMGGAIGMTYLQQYPNDFHAAAFSSPMLGLSTSSCKATKFLTGRKPKYALGQGKYSESKVDFSRNELTGSEIRYNRMNAAFSNEPKARLGGATYQWVNKSCQQFHYINKHIDKLKTPFILFSAENETIVEPKAHRSFVKKAQKLGKTCEAYTILNAQHELFVEKDKQRIQTINHIFEFFAAY